MLAGVDADDRVRKHLRKVFWIAFVEDKDIRFRTGQPPTIDDDYGDLRLPKFRFRKRIDSRQTYNWQSSSPTLAGHSTRHLLFRRHIRTSFAPFSNSTMSSDNGAYLGLQTNDRFYANLIKVRPA